MQDQQRDDWPTADALGLTQFLHHIVVDSTMDEVHRLAALGAPAGLLVIADRQSNGRGRAGRSWTSQPEAGVWMTLLERPSDATASGVLALRLGMGIAKALAPFVEGEVFLKWPNDVYVDNGKLAGILVEARWRDAALEWVAIGVGLNMRVPTEYVGARAVRANVTRSMLLRALVPAMRDASRHAGVLTDGEMEEWRTRDLAWGRRVILPTVGIARGIAADGALLVQESASNVLTTVRAGSLVFAAQ